VENILIPAMERSPGVDFNFSENHLAMRGEAYPEDAAAFFGPLIKAVASHCEAIRGQELRVAFQLDYFNTSSAKALMNLIQVLENAGRAGTLVEVRWYYQSDDDVMREFGEDFSTELGHVDFHLIEI
jgi:hypothetical protein